MKVLLFSDLHDSSRGLNALIDFLNKEKEIGGIVFAGDVTNMGEPLSFAEKFVNEISKFRLPLLWVPGNNDFGESYEVLQNHTKSLEGRIIKLDGRAFTGIGGSPASWESEYDGERSLKKEDIAGKIFVSHYPPNGVQYTENHKYQIANHKQAPNSKVENTNASDVILSTFDKLSVNSAKDLNNSTIQPLGKVRGKQFNNLQLKDVPLVHICGHIHHIQGIGYIGETKVIKLASAALGNVAIMNLDNLEVKFLGLI